MSWTLNTVSLETNGLTLASGSFRTQGTSTLRLNRAADFDATELLPFGTPVTLAYSGTPFFQGKIVSIPKLGSASEEAQIYEISDAWEDLENTVYQETWALGASSYLFPRFVFGLGLNTLETAFERITVGQQINNVIEYAISVGVDLQIGSLPTGEIPIPSEMENLSCAEVIRAALKLHPDWIPWIDHTTTPPTFNVTPVASLTSLSLPLNGTGEATNFHILKRDDLLPDSVRIVYEYATTIDDQVYRNAVIDKYPALGPDGGPRVIGATIPLAGLQMQIQKSRILTRTIPADEAATNAKAFLKANYPHLATVDESHFTIDDLTLTLLADPDTHPDPINPQAERLGVTTLSDIPRQLVKGQIEDWMRRRVGRIWVASTISAAGGATAEELLAIAKGTPGIGIVATNAVTKVYRGISQWIAPEDVPTGIAQSVYQAIHAANTHQGSITISAAEIGTTRYHGKKINFTGGLVAWETINAPVHSVDFDLGSGTTTIHFGPIPALAPQDFLEMQRILRFRPVRWWSFEERGSNLLGGENAPSAAGDTVTGYDLPETLYSPGSNATAATGPFFDTLTESGDLYLLGGQVTAGLVDSGAGSLANRIVLDGGALPSGITAGDKLWLAITADPITDDANEILISGLQITASAYATGATLPATVFPTLAAAGTIILELGRWTASTFLPYSPGNYNLGACNGNLTITRF